MMAIHLIEWAQKRIADCFWQDYGRIAGQNYLHHLTNRQCWMYDAVTALTSVDNADGTTSPPLSRQDWEAVEEALIEELLKKEWIKPLK